MRLLAPLSKAAGTTVFIGDLDPFSIVEYFEMRRMLMRAARTPLHYGGINETWLDTVEEYLRRGTRIAQLRIPLSLSESHVFKRLERAMNVESLVGRRACALLRSGYKIELEGATNPALYRRGHGARLLRLTRDAIALT